MFNGLAFIAVVLVTLTYNEVKSQMSPNGSVIIEPSFLIAEYGSSPSFNCTAEGGPNNTFYWYYNISGTVCNEDCTGTDESFNDFLSNINSSINLTLVGTDPVLTLRNIDSSVGGTYHCVVINEAGFDFETASLYITPTIVTHPMSVNTSAGSSMIMLSCMADSFPDPEYRWEKSSTNEGPYTEIANSEGSTYALGTILHSTNGYYRCIAYTNVSNIINETASNPAIVSVNPSGSIMVSVSSATVSGGDNVTFTCTAGGGPGNTFAWRHNAIAISDGGRFIIESTSFSTLTVTDVIGADFGTYVCEVSNLAGSGTATSRITTSPEGFSTISPVNNITLDRGDDITLNCATTAGPSNSIMYDWLHNATQSVCCPLGQNANITELVQQNTVSRVGMSSDLELTSVNASHGGTYECILSNDAGYEALSTSVFIRPYFVEQPPDNVYTEVDGNVTLDCNAESYLYPSLQWEKRNDAGVFASISGETGRYLMFSSVTTDVIGEYRCIVTVDELDSSITSNVTTIHVSPQNLVTIQPSMIISEPSSDVTFTCNTTAGPYNSFAWFYNVTSVVCDDCTETLEDFLSRVENLTNLTLVGIGPVLTLRNIDLSVGGTYHCVVVNEAGFDIETATLYITPTIVTHPMSVNTTAGSSVDMLSCMAESFPDPEYRWERSSTNEGPYTEIAGSEGSTYALGTIVYSTNGYYRCIAYTNVSNIINETASNPAIVSVSPAGIVSVSPFSATVSGGDNVTLTCSAGGGPNNIFTWAHANIGQISDGGRFIIESTSSSTLTVTDVIGADFGTYICQVSNLAGNGTATSGITTSPEGFSTISPVNNITLVRGDDITLECTTTAGPPSNIMYDWYHNATQSVCCPFGQDANITELVEQNTVSRVGMSSDLELTSVNASHGGTYECILSNDAGNEALSTSVFIRPYFVEQPPDNVYTQVNENVTLDCNAESYPYPSFQWEKKNDAEVFASISGETGRYLMFSSVTTDIIGEYRCIVTVDELDSFITSNVTTIHVSPYGIVTTEPVNVTVSRGESVTLNCSTNAGPGNKFVWLRNGTTYCEDCSNELNLTEIDTDSVSIATTPSVTLSNITAPVDGAQYQCIVINEAGFGVDTSTIFVLPAFVLHPQSVEITAMMNWELTCNAEAFPFPFIRWQKLNATTNDFEDFMEVNGTSLSFNPITHDDFGVYRCVATNVINGEENIAYSDPAILTVSPEGSIDIDVKNETFNYTDTARLECSANGGPNTTFTWYLNDTAIESGDYIFYYKYSAILIISSVSAPQHGGTYTCMASNAAGSTNISTNLFVSPRFLIRPQDVRTQIRFNESLTCEAESYPVPSYSWTKDGSVVGPSDYRYPFYPVEFGDEGEYTCIATSNSLSIDSSAIVHVSPLHSTRTDPNVTNSVVNTPVTFNCLSLGGPNNMYYWVYDRTSERLSNVNELNVTSHASRGGSYTCTVGNQAGYDHAISTLNVAPEILIHPSPQNVTIAVENITLYCLVSGYPYPQVEWYLNDTLILPQFDSRVTITTVNNPTLIPGYDSMGEFSGSGLSDFSLGSGGDSLDIRNPFGVSLDIGDIKDPFGTVSSRLVIKDTTISDSGLYHCEGVIDNLFNDEPSQPALVLVQTVPDEPLNVSSVSVGSRYVNLTWIVPHHNNAPILGYYIFYQCPWFLPCNYIVLCWRWPFIFIDFYLVTHLHPAVTYNFTVIAFNEEGNSSSSLPYSVQTLEEAPGGPPISVKGTALTETLINVVWQKPEEIFRHGVITSYDVRYTPLLDNCTEEEFEGIPANCSDAYVYGVVPMMTNLTGLYIFVNYSISVRARTAVGPGPWSNSTIVMTDPHIPGPVPQPPPVPDEDIKSTEALVKWNPPLDANGIILEYKVTAFPLRPYNSSLNIDSGRRRRQATLDSQVQRCLNFLIQTDNGTERVENGTVAVTVPGTTLQAELTNLVPFSFYEFYVEASTLVGTSMPSSSQTFATLNDVPSNVENLVGSTLDSRAIILSWFSPPCPNDFILGYHIYYIVDEDGSQKRKEIDSSQYSNETMLATSGQLVYSITGLTPQRTYRIHVRAFSDAFIGSVDKDISVELKISVTTPVTVTDENGRPVSVADTTTTGISSINFFLPTAASIARAANLNEVIYYSLVVVPNPMSSFNISRDDFNAAYPNLQPYASRGSNSYYITAAWNNPDDVPNSFKVGDELTTTAVRNGTQESYFNAKLSRQTPYCVYIMVHGKWNMSNDTLVRVFEHTCIDTRLGYNLVALIVLLILAVLILCCLCWLLILLCICCRNRRRNRKQEYVFAAAYNSGHQSSTIKSNIYSGGSFRESIRRSLRNSFRKTEKPLDEMVILANVNNLNEPEVKEPIPVIDFPTYVEQMHKNQEYLFTEEFSRIEPVHAPTRRATRNNKERNRFLNIAAYDHSRVVLEHGPSGSDYINANHINGYDEKSGCYIATQAPLASTVNDFWCMVWEKEAPVIVMLTNLVENDKEKCHHYWPKSATEGENVLEFSSFKVTLLEESLNEHYTIRKLSIEMIGSNEKKTVDQYHFTSWPNYGTPSSSGPLLEFMDIVQQNYTSFDGPMVVHCSSGTGRTGTFIAIMVEMARIKSEKLVDIFNNVQYMRKCRPMMVMNEIEYVFIHDALVEALKLGKIEGAAVARPKSLEETSNEGNSEGSSDKKSLVDEETEL